MGREIGTFFNRISLNSSSNRNIPDKSCRENENSHYMFNHFFLNRTIYEVIRKNTVESGRPQMTTWRMGTACWIPKATNRH